MATKLLILVFTFGWVFGSVSSGWTQVGGVLGFNADTLGSGAGLGSIPTGLGGGPAIPGAIPIKLLGEVHCISCTLEEMGSEANPGDLYQFSLENTHMVIKITQAVPDMAWELFDGHKLFLAPGERPELPQHLMDESQVGKRIEVFGGLAPDAGVLIPLTVKVK